MRRLLPAFLLLSCAAPTPPPPAPPARLAATAPTPTPLKAPEEPPPAELAFPEEAFRAQQPVAGEAKGVKAPALDRFKLPNGISVFLVERHNLPLISLSVEFEGGSTVDPKGKEGLASVCAGLMSEGTQALDKIAFEETLADIASDVNSGAGADEHTVSMGTLSKNLDATLDLWADTILKPGLRQGELDRNLKRRVAGLAQIKGSPAGVAGRLSPSVIYGPDHVFGRFATEASLTAITLADCRKFVADHVKPQGARLFAVGDITKPELIQKLSTRFKGWEGRGVAVAKPGKPQPRKGKIFFVDVPNAAQSVVQLLELGPQRKAPDYFPTSVMSAILGGGFTSRINMNIREKHGYAYGAGGGFQYTRYGSTYRANASVKTDVTKESIQEMLKEYSGLASGEPTDEELVREKDGRILALPAQFATGGQILGAFRELVYFGLPLDYYDTFAAKVRAIDRAAVKKAAARYLKPKELQILVVGDSKVVLPKLKELASKDLGGASIIMLDADGKPAT
jgi:zinc protease